jgi:uncharacterized membrane protein
VLPGVQASIVLLLRRLRLDLVKRDDAAGTWQESHFRWRIRSVLWAGGCTADDPAVAAASCSGWIAWSLISIWFLYRIVRGWLNLNATAPMPT